MRCSVTSLVCTRCMTLRMANDAVEFEAESVVMMGGLLDSEGDAWCKRQCVDKTWWKFICSKNVRGCKSKVRLRFVCKAGAYFGRAVFSILVGLSLSADRTRFLMLS